MYYLITEAEIDSLLDKRLPKEEFLGNNGKRALFSWSGEDVEMLLPGFTEEEFRRLQNGLESGCHVGDVLGYCVEDIQDDRSSK